ncbi:hypothetical protein [Streptomyces chromofuscus]|uniref:Secreted protein n=1 Tax=Streptomyces chromofuscus TaxID=42881 RepID=A0A7M2TA15_STRCW|nr:hypothetical protein [Streptomyces chromofuscus]QOV44548.1 hypothetical protein IPT68_00375 [Streptomyces chromofuscus]GGT42383.1 hypothetical protein GCM10010254_72420 [Streptomyces chromofuscus]
MNTGVKITAYTAAVALIFAAAYGLGAVLDPVTSGPEPATHADHPRSGSENHGGSHADTSPAGLLASQGGYTLDLKTPSITAGKTEELSFAIRDREGRPVTSYRREHGKELHLILASRDLVTYRHLHPTRAADGTWHTPVTLPAAGSYRIFADFTPATESATNLTLGTDLAAAGTDKATALPEPAAATTVDGYTVTLNGELRPGKATELTLTVDRAGQPVTDLEPYLGAYGHLVALRSGDLAYLHVHPNGEPGDGTTKSGPGISFTAAAPSAGTYRLFLDFQHNGTVRTAAFTVQTDKAAGPAEPAGGEGRPAHQH